jgi:outer membrane immunogenic protein
MMSSQRPPTRSDTRSLMRRMLLCICFFGMTSQVAAADLDWPLRGPERRVVPIAPWSGAYFGGQFGYSSATAKFGHGVNDLAIELVKNTTLQPVVESLDTLFNGASNGTNFGGFVGYNSYWEGAILGVEFNYTHTSVNLSGSDSIPPVLIMDDGTTGHHFVYDVSLSGSESIHITDLATFRLRGGWSIDRFMPYAFVAGAVARADATRSATLSWDRTDTPEGGYPDLSGSGGGTKTDNKIGRYYFGYAAGIGMDVLLTPNVFVRGEWEYTSLAIQSTTVNMNSVRAAIGVQF